MPIVLVFDFGVIRRNQLAIYAGALTLLLALLRYYDVARRGTLSIDNTASASFMFAITMGLFIANALAQSSAIEHKFIPTYERFYDTAWKQAVQGILAVTFVNFFVALLFLGNVLFGLIGVKLFQYSMFSPFLGYLATTLAFALAIHVTAVQPAMIRSVRMLTLTLFSWLLPLLAIIIFAFLGQLVFSSLTPLWKMEYPTGVLLGAGAVLILLINSVYQDGVSLQEQPRIKKYATALAIVDFLPLTCLAMWALFIRITQYGWSVNRVFIAAICVVELCYAIGYISSLVRFPKLIRNFELTNVASTYLIIALLVGLYSPIIDPARLMVADQVHRLATAKINPLDFDYANLYVNGQQWGHKALADLASDYNGDQSKQVRALAVNALANASPNDAPPISQSITHMAVYPKGRIFPQSLFDANDVNLAECFHENHNGCTARYMTLTTHDEGLVVYDNIEGRIIIYQRQDKGNWMPIMQSPMGELKLTDCGQRFDKAIKLGAMALTTSTEDDVTFDGIHVPLNPMNATLPCS